jgi:hypothetical protein
VGRTHSPEQADQGVGRGPGGPPHKIVVGCERARRKSSMTAEGKTFFARCYHDKSRLCTLDYDLSYSVRILLKLGEGLRDLV